MIYKMTHLSGGLPWWHGGKESACQSMRHKRHGLNPLVQKIPCRRKLATHSSILAEVIQQTEECEALLSKGLQRVGHN